MTHDVWVMIDMSKSVDEEGMTMSEERGRATLRFAKSTLCVPVSLVRVEGVRLLHRKLIIKPVHGHGSGETVHRVSVLVEDGRLLPQLLRRGV